MHSLDEAAIFKHLHEPSPRAFFLLFYTTQCNQCKIAHARLARIIQKNTFEVDFFTCNLDEAPAVAEYFGIRSVPVCMTYDKKGKQQRVEYALKSEAVYESMVLGINTHKGDPKSRLLGF
ncbi:MAG: thioredoxin family protein [Sulfurospirillaceae bacterium]|nr:thioredoxin family protein [Sulfurospirillaceae bacterium]MDD2825964.1 thioredoxin family protein [Sulfurospirillaceae bacterium]